MDKKQEVMTPKCSRRVPSRDDELARLRAEHAKRGKS
jgi:hypothetical protein